ncbi:MAG: phytanoyl-CoA dioxygenase family protein [Gammaproteobacteria bacterium]|nr:phytanoyl-CoA dioxygenase family protein [Gammaproteobacteria bacterium]MYD80770.1 phytanoyl-CoA dioxygenase family protein [Gammaproteobacteria bacterium]
MNEQTGQNQGLSDEQRYLFDTFGYVVLPNVVSDEQIEELRATLRSPTEQWVPVAQDDGPLHWSKVWRDMLDLPKLSPVLEEIIGNHGARNARVRAGIDLPTFRIDHINVHTHVKRGFPGAHLHGGWKWTGGSQYFSYHDSRFFNGLVSVSFELYDTHPNDGGFCCIPGSHKSNLPLPADWHKINEKIPDCVARIPAVPGDAIVFTEALIHGTLPWNSDATRKTVFYKFSPHGTTWSCDYFNPDDFRQYPDIDDRKLAILEPPNARYHGRPSDPLRQAASE